MATTDSTGVQRPARLGNLNWPIVLGGFAVGILAGAAFLWNVGHSDAKPVAENADHQAAPISAVRSMPVPLEAAQENGAAQLQLEVKDLKQEVEAERLRNEVARLRSELSTLRRANDGEGERTGERGPRTTPKLGAGKTDRSSAPDPSAGELTLGYWNSLNEIIVREASMRSAPAGGLTAASAADFLSRRVDAGRYASSAIRKLETTGIDREVITLGGNLARWYDDNSAVAGKGGNLLGADSDSRQGQPGKRYQSDERGLQQSIAALNREGEQVRAKMSRKYGLPFPKLQ